MMGFDATVDHGPLAVSWFIIFNLEGRLGPQDLPGGKAGLAVVENEIHTPITVFRNRI